MPTWSVLGFGFLLGVSLAVPPGPILALSAQRTVERGFWPGLVVDLGAATGDGTYAVLMGLGLIPFLERFPRLFALLSLGGAALMFFFAWSAWRKARAPPALSRGTIAGRRVGWSRIMVGGFGAGYALALTSPFNLGWWLGAGTALFADYGAEVFVGFFAGIVAWSVVFVLMVLWARTRVQGVVSIVSYASAVLLALFGAWFAARAVPALV